MATLATIPMHVRWQKQDRPIMISKTDTLSTIEQAISDIFDLKLSTIFPSNQIQFYHRETGRFFDLYDQTMDSFKELIEILSTSNAPRKTAKEWCLRIVPKAMPIARQTSLHEDDTWNFQQGNDVDNILAKKQRIAPEYSSQESILPENNEIADEIIDTHGTNNDEMVVDNQNPSQSLTDPNNDTNQTDEVIPINFSFELDVSEKYRLQYESDATRCKSNVVWLHAADQEHVPDREKKYPTLKINNIPENLHRSKWILQLYVLTGADTNGFHYLHPSQGIFDKPGDSTQKQCGTMDNSQLLNPYVMKLSEEDLRKEKIELHLKICNTSCWAQRKNQKLKMFCQLSGDHRSNHHRLLITTTDKQTLSRLTAANLNVSKNHCHVGCVLICENRIYSSCISRLIIEDKKRSPNHDDLADCPEKKSQQS